MIFVFFNIFFVHFQVEKESKIVFDNFEKLWNDGNAQIIVFDGFLCKKKR